MRRIVIAIDGFSGTGKSSTAREVAKILGYTYIDSGAMYRAATLHVLNLGKDPDSVSQVCDALKSIAIDFDGERVLLNGEDVTHEIRTMKVNENVSRVSAISAVRREMVAQQQKMGGSRGIVMDGRDIGTVVFPQAELKIFMTANARVRAERRQLELQEKGVFEELAVVENNLLERDKMDSTRSNSPLIKAEDAVEVDTSCMTFEQQVKEIVELARALIYENRN